jgi:hypothetical protein
MRIAAGASQPNIWKSGVIRIPKFRISPSEIRNSDLGHGNLYKQMPFFVDRGKRR